MGADFVWRMEDVLDLYAEPYAADRPVVCFDELPLQLLADKRAPQPMAPGRAVRVDYEDRRQGTANLFLCFEPLAAWEAERNQAQAKAQWHFATKQARTKLRRLYPA